MGLIIPRISFARLKPLVRERDHIDYTRMHLLAAIWTLAAAAAATRDAPAPVAIGLQLLTNGTVAAVRLPNAFGPDAQETRVTSMRSSTGTWTPSTGELFLPFVACSWVQVGS